MSDWRTRRLEDDDELDAGAAPALEEAPKCQWCDEPKVRSRESGRKHWVCLPCRKQRERYPKCPVVEDEQKCDGPTYGEDRWCYRHGLRKPERSLAKDEVCFVLINPRGEEREVYRKMKDPVPGVPRTARVLRTGGEAAVVTRAMMRKRYLVRDVTMMVWRSARLV